MKLNPLFKFSYTNTRLDKNAGKGGGIITQFFSEGYKYYFEKYGLRGHNGIDYGVPTGTEILAPCDMEITETRTDVSQSYGIAVRGIYLENAFSRYELTFAHLKEFLVNIGDKVMSGQVIALSDDTGNSSGPHLHLSVRPETFKNNQWEKDWDNGYNGAINPLPFFLENNMTVDFALLSKLYTAIFHRNIDEAAKDYAGKDIDFVLDNLINSDEWKKYDPIMKNVKVVENWGRGI